MRREDLSVALGAVLTLSLLFFAASKVQAHLGEDFRKTRDCPQSYWTCETTSSGSAVVGSDEFSFDASARACTQGAAYERSVHRARYACSSSGLVERSSCEAVDTRCFVPG